MGMRVRVTQCLIILWFLCCMVVLGMPPQAVFAKGAGTAMQEVTNGGTGGATTSTSGTTDQQTYAVDASSVQSLTDLFYMKAFSGSTQVLAKMNWVGALMSGIISVFCMLGLFLICLRVILTLMYLSGRNVFDTVHDIKSKSTGTALGLPSLAKSSFNSEYGSGLDAFVGFFLGLLPDVKSYSDYADGRTRYNLSEDDSATTYLLKISIPTVMMIFFLSIGWSGTLWQMYGTVVDALGVAAQKFTDTRLDQIVDRALDADSYYKFSFPATELGKFQKDVASKLYSECLRKTYNLDSTDTQNMGRSISNWVSNNITAKYLNSPCFPNSSTESNVNDAKNFTKSVIVNNAGNGKSDSPSSTSGNTGEFIIRGSDLNLYDGSADNPLYVHVYISRKQRTGTENYFTYNRNTSSTGSQGRADKNNAPTPLTGTN